MANRTVITAEPGKQELFVTREFDAPRHLVFKAHIDPDLYMRWVWPKEFSPTVEEFEMSDGGAYKYTHERAGNKYAIFGVNHEVHALDRIISTYEFDGLPERGRVIMRKTSFEDLPGGRTRLVQQSVFFSVSDRDGMIGAGDMERFLSEGFARLDQWLSNEAASGANA